jgi:hypothetical protein
MITVVAIARSATANKYSAANAAAGDPVLCSLAAKLIKRRISYTMVNDGRSMFADEVRTFCAKHAPHHHPVPPRRCRCRTYELYMLLPFRFYALWPTGLRSLM